MTFDVDPADDRTQLDLCVAEIQSMKKWQADARRFMDSQSVEIRWLEESRDTALGRVLGLQMDLKRVKDALREARKFLPGRGESYGGSGASGATYEIAATIDRVLRTKPESLKEE